MTNAERSASTTALHAAMAVVVLPKLKVGELVPSCRTLGYLFRLSCNCASIHLHKVLDAAGVVVKPDDRPGGHIHRLVVVSLPQAAS